MGRLVWAALRALGTAWLLSGALTAAAAQQPQSPATFRADMERRIAAALPDARLSGGDPMVVRISGSRLDGGVFNLHRIYDYCLAATAEACEAEKQNFVTVMTSARVDELPRGRDNLRIIVRGSQYVDNLHAVHRQGPQSAEPFPFTVRQIGDDLHAILVFDAPTTIMVAINTDVRATGLDSDQAWVLALQQTLRNLPTLPPDSALSDAALALEMREYGGTILLAANEWDRLRRHFGADMFVTVVSDQFVFVGAMPDGEQLNEFAGFVAEDCAASPRCISPGIYRWEEGRWRRRR